MIIDIHGHYTTEPQPLLTFRDKQAAGLADAMRRPTTTELGITDEMLLKSVEPQLKMQRDRGTDLTIFSPLSASCRSTPVVRPRTASPNSNAWQVWASSASTSTPPPPAATGPTRR